MSRNGRDASGKFSHGNAFGRGGSQIASRALEFKRTLIDQVSADDFKEIIAAMVKRAKTGDLPATQELLNRVLGRAPQADLLERIEILEAQLGQIEARFGSR